MTNPINYTILAKALEKLVKQHCTGAPADMGEILVKAIQQHINGTKPKLSVSIGLSEEDAREMIRESRIENAKSFLERMEREHYALASGQLIYVLLKEGNNIATHDKKVADAYYNTGEYTLIEVTLLD